MQVPVEVLSQEDVDRLLAHPDLDDVLGLRDAALMATLYYGAATAVQVAGLNLGDVEFRRGQLWLRGETGTRHRVAIQEPLAGLLQRYKTDSRRLILVQAGSGEQQTQALFLGNRPHRIRVQDIRQILGANVKAAGVPGHVNLSTLRLSRAWHLREQGASPESIQRLLGATSRSGRNVI